MRDDEAGLSEALTNRPPPILPDPDCPICKGQGYPVTATPRVRTECVCVLKARAIAYLTPLYAKATWQKTMKVEGLRDVPNVLIQRTVERVFASVVKSFLLNTGMAFKHETVSGYDILSAWLRGKDDRTFDHYHDVPFLIIRLSGDQRNNAYADTLIPMLRERELKGYRTWVFVPNGIDADRFAENYQPELREFLKTFADVKTDKMKV